MIQRRAKSLFFFFLMEKIKLTNEKETYEIPAPFKVHGSCASNLRGTWISLMLMYSQLSKGAFEALLENNAYNLSKDCTYMLREN